MVTEKPKAKAKKKKNQWSRKVQIHIHIKSYTCPIVTSLSENIYVWVEASCSLNCKKHYQIHQDGCKFDYTVLAHREMKRKYLIKCIAAEATECCHSNWDEMCKKWDN